MKKFAFIGIMAGIVLAGCSSKAPVATIEATDYALSCETLLQEIRETREKWQDEGNINTTKNIVGGVLTFGIYGANKEDELMLRERVKALQLIYTIKQAKGECKELSKKDIDIDTGIAHNIKTTKTNASNAIEAAKN